MANATFRQIAVISDRPLHDNADGTFSAGPYLYRPVLADGRRVRHDPNDNENIVLWDPYPLSNGKYLAMTRATFIYQVSEADIRTWTIREHSRGTRHHRSDDD